MLLVWTRGQYHIGGKNVSYLRLNKGKYAGTSCLLIDDESKTKEKSFRKEFLGSRPGERETEGCCRFAYVGFPSTVGKITHANVINHGITE